MRIEIAETPRELGRAAGAASAAHIREAIHRKGSATILLATGTSQYETLRQLTSERDIEWSRVVMFHLDEYIGLPITHKASFRKFLQDRFLSTVPQLKAVYLINGEADPEAECQRLNELIGSHPVDVALIGIGENGHLAFNDPPADFETENPYIIVNLDEACKQQQLNEGWYSSMAEVPKQAISMSIKQIMKSAHIVCSVPDERKAVAVKNTLEQGVSNLYPASILQRHRDCTLYLDKGSSSLLSAKAGSMLTSSPASQ
jgi:glucosamine-6-phosphate deaminase